ncbi:hypothetical protein DMUE_0876 [Dictyocoela muelleri]|nr:hypothetical protein DMUE_0876 [Dictyocoela muelleri]
MLFVQKGRLITNTILSSRDKLGIIKDIINNKSVIVEFEDGIVERRSVRSLKLLDKVIDESNFKKDINSLIKWYHETAEFKNFEKERVFKMMNDYERFVEKMKMEVEQEVIKEKFGN